jgi:hypothetical protein
MTDKELLELAAKAAGIERRNAIGFYVIEEEDDDRYWNPLTNDGDALRLAVKLNIEIYQANDEGMATYAGYFAGTKDARLKFCVEYHDDIKNMGDPYAATRLAIVRAAAEIGKEMK